jgi:chromate transport protein ChrA
MDTENILEKFQKAVQFRKTSEICILVGAFFLLFMNIKSLVILITGIVFVIVGIVLMIVFWKCPSCGKHLTILKTANVIEKCPSCGVSFKE